MSTQYEVYIDNTYLQLKKIIKSDNERSYTKGSTISNLEEIKIKYVMVDIPLLGLVNIQVPIEHVLIKYNSEQLDIDDMINIQNTSKVDLLYNLKNRYFKKKIYTYVGETLLVINPFEKIDIYSNKYKNDYIFSNINNTNDNKDSGHQQSAISPHIFQITKKIIDCLLTEKSPQALVISGESGAGKTETTKHAMSFFAYFFENLTNDSSDVKKRASINNVKRESIKREAFLHQLKAMQKLQDKSLVEIPLEEKILSCNPIFESFGNAKTVRNDNSSRFGRYIKLFVDMKNKEICGSFINTYLLEKSRVTNLNSGERNYHIFYQLISFDTLLRKNNYNINNTLEIVLEKLSQSNANMNFNKKEREKDTSKKYIYSRLLQVISEIELETMNISISEDNPVDNIMKFSYLRNDIYQINQVKTIENEAIDFVECIISMIITNISNQSIIGIIQSLCIILHFGNMEVNEGITPIGEGAVVTKGKEIEVISKVLNIEEEVILSSLTTNIRVVQNEKIKSPLTKKDCLNSINSLVKEIYQRAFNLIVFSLNSLLLPDILKDKMSAEKDKDQYSYIGILDIFGFESFNENYFEQLCINYTNEKLQQIYNNDVFKENKRLFQQEGLEKEYVEFAFNDNQHIIDVFDKHPSGIYYLLDNECNVKGKDMSLLDKICSVKSSVVSKSLKVGKFQVNHSVKEVEYNIKDFIDKNLDELRGPIKDMLNDVKNNNIKIILNQESPQWPKYLGGKFRTNLASLVEDLKLCKCHYVRCIKSNEEKKPNLFMEKIVYNQVLYLGILETIRLRQEGYSVRMKFPQFYLTFGDVLPKRETEMKAINLIKIKELNEILNIINVDNSKDVLIGKTYVFMKQKFYNQMIRRRNELIRDKNQSCLRISAMYNGYLIRKRLKRLKIQVPIIQTKYRKEKYRRQFIRMRQKVKKIQIFYKRRQKQKRKEKLYRLMCLFARIKKIIERKRYYKKFMKSFNLIKSLIYRRLYKIRVRKYKKIKEIVNEIVNISLEKVYERSNWSKIIKIQNNFRMFLFKKRNVSILSKVTNIREKIRIIRKYIIIQKVYKGYYIRRRIETMKINTNLIVSFYKMVLMKRHYLKIKYSTEVIKTKWIKHFFKNKVFYDGIKAVTKSIKLHVEKFNYDMFKNIFSKTIIHSIGNMTNTNTNSNISNHNKTYNKMNSIVNKSIQSNRNSNAYNNIDNTSINFNQPLLTNEEYINLGGNLNKPIQERRQSYFEKIYEKKVNNAYLNKGKSVLNLSPYDFPKLHFFMYIVNVEVFTDINNTFSDWSDTLKQVISKNISSSTPIMSIEIGGFHTSCLNSAGKVFSWGHNCHGQMYCDLNEVKLKKVGLTYMSNQQEENDDDNKISINSKEEEIEDVKDNKEYITLSNLINSRNPLTKQTEALHPINNSPKLKKRSQNESIKHKQKLGQQNIFTVPKEKLINSFSSLIYIFNSISPLSSKIRQIVNGEDYSISVTKDNEMIVSGNNKNYQLGIKESSNIYYPFNLSTYLKTIYPDLKDLKVKEVKISNRNVFFVNTHGKLYLLSNFRANSTKFLPLISFDIKSLYSIKVNTIECGKGFTIILSDIGVLYGMGDNMYGQLGLGDFKNRNTPTEIISLKACGVKTIQISCGYKHVVIKTSTGKVYTWGCVRIYNI